jgi:GDP/UDP-N,N'-diacetylbacillosamine 2-epimerase (hydrolysing)
MIITGSRGEYGYIRPIIKGMDNYDNLEYIIVATNMLLAPEFGYAINNFYRDNIDVRYKIEMSMSGYSNSSMTKSLGIFLQSLTDIVSNDKPDVILLAGDRSEQLVGAIVGAHMNIPVAHIQAGELSGNIDGMSRHAITKFGHIHFASNLDAKQRLLNMGEQEFRVFNTGAPQLDEFCNYNYLTKDELYDEFSLNKEHEFCLLVQHPVTEESSDSENQMNITLSAIINSGIQTVLIYPNNDAGSTGIQNAIDDSNLTNIHIRRNVDREFYANLMKHASFLIGNSSSSILEAPTFELPAINIGRRQNGRLQAKNIINVDFDVVEINKAILKARDLNFKNGLKGLKNPYGDGQSSLRILDILENLVVDENLLNKQLTY